MSKQRQHVEAEARKLYPDAPADEVFWINELRGAFIGGRTVTDEQVEAATYALIEDSTDVEDRGISESTWQEARREVRIVLSRAGLLIEGDDDE